jgi:hypothetical protein
MLDAFLTTGRDGDDRRANARPPRVDRDGRACVHAKRRQRIYTFTDRSTIQGVVKFTCTLGTARSTRGNRMSSDRNWSIHGGPARDTALHCLLPLYIHHPRPCRQAGEQASKTTYTEADNRKVTSQVDRSVNECAGARMCTTAIGKSRR